MTRSRDKRHHLALEPLEARNLAATSITASLAGGILKVEGTTGADQVTLRQSDGNISIALRKITWNGASVDSVPASQVNDISVSGLGGDDTLRVEGSITKRSFLYGGAGNDTLQSGNGRGILYGNDGNDVLVGAAADDLLYGGAGNDKLYGSRGADMLYGEAGNDYLDGGAGSDYLNGGDGDDTFRRNILLAGQYNSEDRISHLPVPTQPTTDDFRQINQQESPTCAFLASLAATAKWTGAVTDTNTANRDLLSRLSYDASKDQYGVRLFVNGYWQVIWVKSDWNETVDPGGSLWVTLFQKAYLKSMDVVTHASNGSYLPSSYWVSSTGKGWQNPANALQALTGVRASYVAASGALPADLSRLYLAGKRLVGLTKTIVSDRLVGYHSYMVDGVYQESGTWKLRLYNPWAHDRQGATLDGKDDGFVTITWSEFQANFTGYCFN